MTRTVLALAVLAAVLVFWHPRAEASGYTRSDTEAALVDASPMAACIVYAETGGTLDPYAVGQAGELGIAQLHPRGMLPEFYARGFRDPFSPYQSMAFLELELREGRGAAWSTYWGCRW